MKVRKIFKMKTTRSTKCTLRIICLRPTGSKTFCHGGGRVGFFMLLGNYRSIYDYATKNDTFIALGSFLYKLKNHLFKQIPTLGHENFIQVEERILSIVLLILKACSMNGSIRKTYNLEKNLRFYYS